MLLKQQSSAQTPRALGQLHGTRALWDDERHRRGSERGSDLGGVAVAQRSAAARTQQQPRRRGARQRSKFTVVVGRSSRSSLLSGVLRERFSTIECGVGGWLEMTMATYVRARVSGRH